MPDQRSNEEPPSDQKPAQPDDSRPAELSRRQFIAAAGVLGAGLAIGKAAQAQSQPSATDSPGGGSNGGSAGGASMEQDPSGAKDNGPSQSSRKDTGALASDSSGPGAPRAIPDGSMYGDGDVPQRQLGKTGMTVSAIGVGGHHLGDADTVNEAMAIVHQALDYGVTFFDNCWEYHNGKSEDWLGRALATNGRRDKAIVMTKVCTHGRTKELAMKMLEESLRRLQTDHIDVWQIHAITFDNDPELAYAKGGVIEALELAKQQGKVRAVGFTGHKDPVMHLHMIELGFPFDTCQFPVNPLDYNFFSFERLVLPECNRRGIAALGMKPMGGTGNAIKQGLFTAEEMLGYAMSAPVATTITGIDSLNVLAQNLRVARGFQPLDQEVIAELRTRCAGVASDGRLEPYKVSLQYDNPWTRMPHGFPIDPTVKEVKDMLQQGIATPGEILPTT